MLYQLTEDKKIRIPDDILELNMTSLGLSKEEAIQLYLEDEGYLDNEEQNRLCELAAKNRITATIHEARADSKKKKPREQKPDPVKEEIIKSIADLLKNYTPQVEIANKSKEIHCKIGEDWFKIDLVRSKTLKKEKEGS